jgi:hypothetical protein
VRHRLEDVEIIGHAPMVRTGTDRNPGRTVVLAGGSVRGYLAFAT